MWFTYQHASRGGLHDIQLNDVSDFTLTDQAMGQMGITDAERQAIYTVVAGVLHLGNIDFEEDPDSKGSVLYSDSHVLLGPWSASAWGS